jgi:shikimate kinase
MNLVLIGYRGTGKTVIARLLAEQLGMKCISMDAEIVRQTGLEIPEIVEKHGWEAFRNRETQVARQLAEMDDIIVDTGGGVIERSENIEALKANSLIFWLKASAEVIVSRIASSTERPALTEGKTFTQEVADILAERIPKYAAAAHFEIETDKDSPDRAAAHIAEIWGKKTFKLP